MIRGDQQGKKEAENRAPEVGIVVDVVALALAHVGRIHEVQDCKDDAGNGDKKDQQLRPGREINRGKQDRCHTAGSAEGTVVRIVPVFEERRNRRRHNPRQIQADVSKGHSHRCIQAFYIAAHKIEGEHIEHQVHRVLMNKAGSQKAVIIGGAFHAGGPQNGFVDELGVPETGD